MKQLIECVPNFSEGNDMEIIKKITDEIESVDGVKLLDVDPGKATNRTVVTFVGEPDAVIEAAFLSIKKATELIDMSKHYGEHPRMGATDVCPLVPIANISMEEVVKYAHKLGKRVGEELDFPIYFYEFAATEEKRKNLANVRKGEYEGLTKKMKDPDWKPDFGPAKFVPKTGATAISARNFLVAYNFNLNTTSTRRANAIAFDVREAGRIKKVNGKKVLDKNGNPERVPGTLKATKAIGWYIEEYGIAQISMNLTDITITSIHKAFEEVDKSARSRGIRVTGSELVGLVPKQALLDAAKYFLKKQQRSLGIDEKEMIKIAVKSLGLDDLKPFIPEERIIEYLLEDDTEKPLVNMTLSDFVNETASESPAPGGGSISAYMGAMGIALATMVANLSSHKRGWDDQWEKYSKIAEQGQELKEQLVNLVDEDTQAFNKIMNSFSLPKSTEEEKRTRKKAIQDATLYATKVPFRVMKLAAKGMSLAKQMAEIGNPNSVTDAGVGALAIRSAVMGAFLNVKINAADLDDKKQVEKFLLDGEKIEKEVQQLEKEVLQIVNDKIN
jgi:glutamate formiminotransferase/formiminotetrahydrofolate cyclodeaminase